MYNTALWGVFYGELANARVLSQMPPWLERLFVWGIGNKYANEGGLSRSDVQGKEVGQEGNEPSSLPTTKLIVLLLKGMSVEEIGV